MSVLSQTVPESKYYNHSHFKWIWLIGNDQLRCNQSNKDYLTIYCTFRHFGLSVYDSNFQGPNQVLAPEAKAKALMSKAKDKAKY